MEGSIQEALSTLQAERERLDQAIAALEGLAVAGNGTIPSRSVGRPPVRKSSEGKSRKAKNAPRGLLQSKAQEALKSLKPPVSAAALRDAVIKAGYPSKNEKSLYTSLFALAKKKSSGIKKTDAGFMLSK